MAAYCEEHGRPNEGWPYFSLDGEKPFDPAKWSRMRSLWVHTHGLTNVWSEPPVHGSERLRVGDAYLHANQKPLSLMRLQIRACTEPGDVVWEPFGGLCSASVAAQEIGRRSYAAEVHESFYEAAKDRLRKLPSEHSEAVA
jgi:site-specific DNA-methyltransferase (adenine-specific)